MAVLQTIRSWTTFLLIVLGLALLAFIFEEGVRSCEMSKAHNAQCIGEIYGDEIYVQDFQKLLDEQTEMLKLTYQKSSLTDDEMNYVKDQVWNELVSEKLLQHEADELGLTVSDDEIRYVINNGMSPLLQQSPFTNQQTGRFDVNILKQFLNNYQEAVKSNNAQALEQMSALYKYWKDTEKKIRQNTLMQKYQVLLGASLMGNKDEAKEAFEARTKSFTAQYVALPYTSVQDKQVNCTDEEVKQKYEAIKDCYFKMPVETRDIKYVSLQVTPSAADRAELDSEMKEYAAQLATSEHVEDVVRQSGSLVAYSNVLVRKEGIRAGGIEKTIDSLTIGKVVGPFKNAADNSTNIVKLINKTMQADSVQFQMIGAASAETADSIIKAYKAGAAFDSIAKKYQQPATKQWLTSSQYEGQAVNESTANYINGVMNAAVNEPAKIDMGTQGVLVVNVLEKKNPVTKYNVAIIKRVYEFSKDTYTKAYNKFSEFVASNQTLQSMEQNAAKSGFQVLPAEDITTAEHKVANINDTRDALKWIFNKDTKVNTISPLYECGNNDNLLVCVLTGINKAGYVAFDKVKENVRQMILKDKKAEKLMAELKNCNSIAAAVKNPVATAADTVKFVTMAGPARIAITNSSEPMLTGVICSHKPNDFISAVKGEGGVFAVKVLKMDVDKTSKFNEKTELMNLNRRNIQYASSFMSDLYQKANVVDNRYLFF